MIEKEVNRDEAHLIPLMSGRTDGENISGMVEGKFYSTGYNSKYGLMDVCEDNGDSIFEGRVNIENELPRMLSRAGSSSPENVDQYLTNRTQIMRLESELAGSEIDPNEIKLKIDEYRDELGFDFNKVDSEVEDYIMDSYHNYLWNCRTRPENHVSSSEPVLEVPTCQG